MASRKDEAAICGGALPGDTCRELGDPLVGVTDLLLEGDCGFRQGSGAEEAPLLS